MTDSQQHISETMSSAKPPVTPKPIDLGAAIVYEPNSITESAIDMTAKLAGVSGEWNKSDTPSQTEIRSKVIPGNPTGLKIPGVATAQRLKFKPYHHPDMPVDTSTTAVKETATKPPPGTAASKANKPTKPATKNKAPKIVPAPKATVPKKAPPKKTANKPVAAKSAMAKGRGKKAVALSKPVSEDEQKLARFSYLLSTFLHSANALQDEFGGIPDQMEIISDRFNNNMAVAVVNQQKSSTGEESSTSNQQGALLAAPQYSMRDGIVQLPDGTPGIHQDPKHISRILQDLSRAPIGFNSSEHRIDYPKTPADVIMKETGDTLGTVKDKMLAPEEAISLSSVQLSTAKDCLTIVHYMNDYSILNLTMFEEARAAWIRQFGWAPSMAEMMQAKLRAREYREESGRHITALGTNPWATARREAYEVRGEAAVWEEQSVEGKGDNVHGSTVKEARGDGILASDRVMGEATDDQHVSPSPKAETEIREAFSGDTVDTNDSIHAAGQAVLAGTQRPLTKSVEVPNIQSTNPHPREKSQSAPLLVLNPNPPSSQNGMLLANQDPSKASVTTMAEEKDAEMEDICYTHIDPMIPAETANEIHDHHNSIAHASIARNPFGSTTPKLTPSRKRSRTPTISAVLTARAKMSRVATCDGNLEDKKTAERYGD